MQPVLVQSVDAPSDRGLLARSTDGDQDAFRTFYERHVGAVFGYVSGRVGPGAAEDLTSETFVEAWNARSRFDPRMRSARPWLYGIATNVVARHREREERWLASIDTARERTDDRVEPLGIQVDIDLARALRRLSPPLRDVLLLTAIADLRVADAARALGISTVAARVRLHRARSIVSSELGDPT